MWVRPDSLPHIQDVSSSNLHFLILVILKFQSVQILLGSFNLCSIECRRFRVPSEYLLSNREVWKRNIRPGDRDQCCSCCLVNLTWSPIFVRFRVLDFVSNLAISIGDRENAKLDQMYRFLFATSEIEVMLHCIH